MNSKFLWPFIIWSGLLLIGIVDMLQQAKPVYEFSMYMGGLILNMGIVGLIKPQWIFLPNRKISFLVFFSFIIGSIVFIFNFDTEIQLAKEQAELARKEAKTEKDPVNSLPSPITTSEKLTRSEVREICMNELSHVNPNSLPDDLGEIKRKARQDVAACSARYGY